MLAVEVRDPREQELADVGELRLVDPESGRQLRVDTSSARLRERFAEAAQRRAPAARDDALLGSASATSHSRPRATGSGRWRRSCAAASGAVELRGARPAALPARRSGGGRRATHGSSGTAPTGPRPGRRPPWPRTSSPLTGLAPARSGRVLLLVGVTLLLVGFARPKATITVKRHEATVVLVLDVSGSMAAKDVAPSRLAAARAAAEHGSSRPCRRRIGSP